MSYTQNDEEKYILEYFDGEAGSVLDIGANDGKTFSNSLSLIESGRWHAVLIEPDADAFEKLVTLHETNDKVYCYNIAIADKDGELDFYKSGTHLNLNDTGLLSTTSEKDYFKWASTTTFTKTITAALSWQTFFKTCPIKKFEFITIDAEGQDWNILQQLDLKELGCEMICIEHNGNEIDKYINYCKGFGFEPRYKNAENIILIIPKHEE